MILGSKLLFAQQMITGVVKDEQSNVIMGANVFLEGSFDGATTNELGQFQFTTQNEGSQVLKVSMLSFETKSMVMDVTKMTHLNITLRADVEVLDAVVLSAGSFEASDNSRVSVLKPLDVVTTANALGDVFGALQTLPGTSTLNEDGRLFVRGGRAEETQVFIDGIRVFTPYTPTTNNIPTRGRYSPFLFDGITFSTGGYSAEYGQALSSVLLLNTENEPDQNKTDIGIMSVGGNVGHTKKWDRSSLSGTISYTNLVPYLAIFNDRNTWEKPFETVQGETVFRQRFSTGLLKFYAAFDTTQFKLNQPDINFQNGVDLKLNNRNFYLNTSYKGTLGDNWSIGTGLSFTAAKNNFNVNNQLINSKENSFHAKIKFKKRFSSRLKLNLGVEQFSTDFKESFEDQIISADLDFSNPITAGFSELDVMLSKKLAFKVGLRLDYHSQREEWNWSPRIAAAYKISQYSQLSLAYGEFYQTLNNEILKFNSQLNSQRATHYILNYQYVEDDRLFRAEVYRKSYNNLITFNTPEEALSSTFLNNGFGYAQGLDLFWRDNKSIKNLDYWLSYSFLDSKRKEGNYNEQVRPPFALKHNLSIIGKYWIDDLKSQVGLAYTFASGRPYTNPNTDALLSERTQPFHSLSLNWAYLITPQKILYASVNNVLGIKNINGYQYSNTPDQMGNFQRRALRPATDQFFFIGFFWTISESGRDNQLNNL